MLKTYENQSEKINEHDFISMCFKYNAYLCFKIKTNFTFKYAT